MYIYTTIFCSKTIAPIQPSLWHKQDQTIFIVIDLDFSSVTKTDKCQLKESVIKIKIPKMSSHLVNSKPSQSCPCSRICSVQRFSPQHRLWTCWTVGWIVRKVDMDHLESLWMCSSLSGHSRLYPGSRTSCRAGYWNNGSILCSHLDQHKYLRQKKILVLLCTDRSES